MTAESTEWPQGCDGGFWDGVRCCGEAEESLGVGTKLDSYTVATGGPASHLLLRQNGEPRFRQQVAQLAIPFVPLEAVHLQPHGRSFGKLP